MPKSTKDRLKMHAAGALNMLDRSIVHLVNLYETFEPTHAEYAEFLDLIITNSLQTREFILDFWAKTWGSRPDNYRDWL